MSKSPNNHCNDGEAAELRRRVAELEAENATLRKAGETAGDQGPPSPDFRSFMEMVDQLLACEDVDSLCKAAVEQARERLGLDRCGMHLLEGGKAQGTWGTDSHGQTIDEHHRLIDPRPEVTVPVDDSDAETGRWSVVGPNTVQEVVDGEEVAVEVPWRVATPIQTEHRRIGTFFNDSTISGANLDVNKQHILEAFCAFLATLIERKRLAAGRKGHAEMLGSLLAAIPNMVCYKALDGMYQGCNQAFEDFCGLPAIEIVGKFAKDIRPIEEATEHESMDAQLLAEGGVKCYESCMVDAEGRSRTALINKAIFKRGDGSVGGIVSVITDITDQKAAVSALRDSERKHRILGERLRAIIEIADQLIVCPNVDAVCRKTVELVRTDLAIERCAVFLRKGEIWQGTWGTSLAGEVIPEHALNLTDACANFNVARVTRSEGARERLIHDATLWDWDGEKSIEIGQGWHLTLPIYAADLLVGVFVADAAISGIQPNPGQLEVLDVLCSLLGSILDGKRMQEDLEEEHYLLRTLIDNMTDYIFLKDRQSRYTLNNATHLQLLGAETQEEVLGKSDADILPSDLASAYFEIEQEAMQAGKPIVNREEEFVGTDGSRRMALTTRVPLRNNQGKVTGLIGMSRDITDHKEMENQLRQAEKMDSIGQLAGGIAHDFNNQLSAILGFADILKYELSDQPKQRHYAELILSASRRSADLTKKLLAFARKGKWQVEPVGVHEILDEVVLLLERSVDKRIAIRQHLEADPDAVMGDPGQLHSALLNVGINARDAMPNGGELCFATTNVTLNQAMCQGLSLAVNPGNYVRLDVTDDGIGMDAETRRRIFEPFFTTKSLGRGTGMGLASVYGTIKNHKGTIEVFSAPGKGSTFRIYLPVVERIAEPAKEKEKEPKEGVPPRPASARVMVVDDEAIVCKVVRRMLEGLGHSVKVYESSREALAFYAENQDQIDLIVLDMIMPELSGKDFYAKVREINPDVKVILSSGYSRDRVAQEILHSGVMAFIQKPFMLTELAEIVNEVLGSE